MFGQYLPYLYEYNRSSCWGCHDFKLRDLECSGLHILRNGGGDQADVYYVLTCRSILVLIRGCIMGLLVGIAF